MGRARNEGFASRETSANLETVYEPVGRGPCRVATVVAITLAFACSGADSPDAEALSSAEGWRRAQDLWERREIGAWDAWRALDPATPEGAEAHRRLAEADGRYREGVRRLREGAPDARTALLEGVAVAPMDPRLYLPLARACRDRGLEPRAVEYYLKFLAAVPSGPDAEAARAELQELGPELAGVFDPAPSRAPSAPHEPSGAKGAVSAPIAGLAGAALLGAVVLGVAVLRRGSGSLDRLAERSPELHPAIAYLVGSLRHELLKHRIGAVGDALRALDRGDASEQQLAFLTSRLFGGEPLREAWRGYLRAFDRALGFRLDLRRDPWFRKAGRAIGVIAALEGRLGRHAPGVQRRLGAAHARLRDFDRHLADLVGRLVRTRIDGALLRGVVEEVRAEYLPGRVELDELRVDDPDEPVEVEVFRVDLVLIVKNVVRNAILAVGRAAPPRRVAVDVVVDLEPTGEEVVRLRVRDSSEEAPSVESLHDRRADRGLALVTAALSRYDGSIDVEPGTDGYAKAVTLRFFRALPAWESDERQAA